MPYNEQIEARISTIVSRWKNTDAKMMFGGVCHLIHGHMFCGVYKDFLVLRLGEQPADETLKQPHVKPFDITGKPMRGWIMVEEQGFKSDDRLREWLNHARDFVRTLPSKRVLSSLIFSQGTVNVSNISPKDDMEYAARSF